MRPDPAFADDAPIGFAASLARHADRPALVTEDGTGAVSYAELAERVRRAMERLGGRRRLVLLAAANEPDAIVHYLAALAGGHPVILVDADNREARRRLIEAYDPDVHVLPRADGDGWETVERRERSRHRLHPDLALLLSTSGSTGSPKLVRLSRGNLDANAESIASYLGVTEGDRAITSLPMAYCYGLSVINSHLQRGASVVLTRRSVVDPAFWDLARRTGATSFAGVPYTFELLDRAGFADLVLPDLRAVTQAGGRMDPAAVRRYAELGRRRGWEFVVMYGATEATARMGYLPPRLATSRPEAVGRPVPGGSFRIDPAPDAPEGAGELVYRGPNVMLGYAERASDLALGRTVEELRTGDLARIGPDGLTEIVGRRAAFLKIAGVRVDLHAVERLAASLGARAAATGTDDRLVVFVERDASPRLASRLREAIGIPARAFDLVTLPELPRLASGKIDRPRLRALAADRTSEHAHGPDADPSVELRALYAAALGRPAVTDRDSFASLGGDSLSYVEVTLGIERILGRLPDGWASMSLGALATLAAASPGSDRRPAPMRRWRAVETSVALRAIAIVLIVAGHIGMTPIAGGAHVLMAVAGYNFARFRLTPVPRGDRLAAQLRAVARIAVPAMVWVALAMVLLGQYEVRHLLLVNALVRDELWGNLWFIELLVYIGLAMAALLAVPAFDRAERRWPFAVAIGILGAGLLFRFGIVDLGVPYTMPVLWLFAIGWAASRANVAWQRALVAAIALVSVPGYFDAWERNATILAGVLLLVAVPRVVVPAPLARLGGVLAGASLAIYLVHWEVWPMFDGWYGVPALVASIAAGIGVWLLAARATTALSGLPARIGSSVATAGSVLGRDGGLRRAAGLADRADRSV